MIGTRGANRANSKTSSKMPRRNRLPRSVISQVRSIKYVRRSCHQPMVRVSHPSVPLRVQNTAKGLERIRQLQSDEKFPGLFGPLIELFSTDEKFHRCVEITAQNRSVCLQLRLWFVSALICHFGDAVCSISSSTPIKLHRELLIF